MKITDRFYNSTGHARFLLQVLNVSFLIFLIGGGTRIIGVAEAITIGDETVTIGQHFVGSSLSSSGFFPPDTMGAVAPTSFVELLLRAA